VHFFGFKYEPYFCLHEYKKESDPSGDPRGQVLIAMLAAQEMNQDGKPIYGLYVTGKLWRFMVLTGKTDAFSKTDVADQENIDSIFKVLKGLRHAIEQVIKI
jgi:RNA polymerase-interacting CarD/CdnL/TRCF family regulator